MHIPDSEEGATHTNRTFIVYNVTEYIRDHPGGPDVLFDVAGMDATEVYNEIGHSDEADEILESYLIGRLQGTREVTRPKPFILIPQDLEQPHTSSASIPSDRSSAIDTARGTMRGIALASGSIAGGSTPVLLQDTSHAVEYIMLKFLTISARLGPQAPSSKLGPGTKQVLQWISFWLSHLWNRWRFDWYQTISFYRN